MHEKAELNQLFEDYICMSFSEFVTSVRLELVLALLGRRDKNITEIAYESGFGSLRTFNRVFAQYMKCTPTRYRRDHRTGYADETLS